MTHHSELNLIAAEHLNGNEEIWIRSFDESDVINFHQSIDQKLSENPQKPIIIHIQSYGGSVHGLFAMLDIMDAARTSSLENFCFITHAIGYAMSSAAVLLSYGDYRFASPRTSIMLHQIQAGTGWGSPHPDNKVEFKEQERINAKLIQTLHEQCKFQSKKSIQEMTDRNFYLDPQHALKVGLIDSIGFPQICEYTAYEINIANQVLNVQQKVPKGKTK